MCRTGRSFLALLVLAAVAEAQEPTTDSSRNEVGILVGVSVLGAEGNTVTTVAIPGAAGAFGPGALYAARIMRPWIVEAHFSLNSVSGTGTTDFTQTYLAVQADYLLSRAASGAPYLFANVATFYFSGDLEGEESMIGAGVGYRLHLKGPFVTRLEGRYRRWLDSDLNEYSVLIAAGARF
jgi:hypothetical protein